VKCIEDEIPFELPEGWAWTRLGNLSAAIQYGLSNSAEPQGVHRLLRITDIQDGKVNWDTVPYTTAADPDTYLLKSGDIVFARTGATVGKSFLITETPYPSVYASYLIRIRLLGELPPEYIYHFFDSACYWSQITDKSVGVGQPNCNGTSLKELFVPLPPINEQLRIIPTAQTLLEYVGKIETDRKELLSIITGAKSKILDLAIRGQLVPQDPNDEPASVLLKRIRAEKEELIKQGKIKRDKKESVIFKGEDNSYYEKIGDETRCIDDELPFEIPDTWEWTRMRNLMQVIGGVTYDKNDVSTTGIRILRGGNLLPNNTIAQLADDVFLPLSYASAINQVRTGDIVVVASTGSATVIGKPAFIDIEMPSTQIGGFLRIVRPTTSFAAKWLQVVFLTNYYRETIVSLAKGTNINNIKAKYLEELLLPLPAKNDLELIVDRIKVIINSINSIENMLCQSTIEQSLS
jgi:type I restriction enzyme S subunit